MCGYDDYFKHMPIMTLHDGREVCVDKCIAPLVYAMNAAGLRTVASCCGHGHQPTSVILEDDRWVLILTREQAQKVCSLFPSIVGAPPMVLETGAQ